MHILRLSELVNVDSIVTMPRSRWGPFFHFVFVLVYTCGPGAPVSFLLKVDGTAAMHMLSVEAYSTHACLSIVTIWEGGPGQEAGQYPCFKLTVLVTRPGVRRRLSLLESWNF